MRHVLLGPAIANEQHPVVEPGIQLGAFVEHTPIQTADSRPCDQLTDSGIGSRRERRHGAAAGVPNQSDAVCIHF